MQKTIDETNRRRAKQIAFNLEHHITPTTIIKSKEQVFAQTSVLDIKGYDLADSRAVGPDDELVTNAAEDQAIYKTVPRVGKGHQTNEKDMEKAARDLDFMEAARLRDEMFKMQQMLVEMKG